MVINHGTKKLLKKTSPNGTTHRPVTLHQAKQQNTSHFFGEFPNPKTRRHVDPGSSPPVMSSEAEVKVKLCSGRFRERLEVEVDQERTEIV